MTCTYDLEAIDQMRLLTADLDSENPLLSDNQLGTLLGMKRGSVLRASAQALRTIAASEVLVAKKITTQDLSTDGPAVAAELRAQAAELEAQAEAEEQSEEAFAAFIPGPGLGAPVGEGVEARAYPW